MERYIFSGSMTDEAADLLEKTPGFEPIDVLVSQVDRTGVKKMIKLYKRGLVKSFFLDSGAYSVHTGKFQTTVDEYIDFANSIDEYCWCIAQLDTIPGKFGQPKNPQDYLESAEKSWENYLYMKPRMKSPEKLLYAFHQGEPYSALKRIVDWEDKENGYRCEYLAISPANDTSTAERDAYLEQSFRVLQTTSRPDIKVHLFGYTSLQGLKKFPAYSCDSTSHVRRVAMVKVYTDKWGIVALSDRPRSARTKDIMNFTKICDKDTLEEFRELLRGYNLTIEDVCTRAAARLVVDIMETLKSVNGQYKYTDDHLKTKKSLW